MINLKFNNNKFQTAFSTNSSNNISIIVGAPGSGKSAFLNCLNLHLQNETKVPMAIVDIFEATKGSLLETKDDNHIIDLYTGELSFSNNKSFFINPLELSFGFDKPTNDDSVLLHTFLSSLFYCKNDTADLNTEKVINYIINNLYNNKKYYFRGENNLIDFKLNKYGIYNTKLSWKVLTNIFISNNEPNLAYMAHSHSMPLISDIISLFENEKFVNLFCNKINIEKLKNKLNNYINIFTFFNKPTNIHNIEKTDIELFSLDKNHFNEEEIVSAQIVFLSYLYKELSSGSIINENIDILKSKDIPYFMKKNNLYKSKTRLMIDELYYSSSLFYCISFYQHIVDNIIKRNNIDLILSTHCISFIPFDILKKINKFYIIDLSRFDYNIMENLGCDILKIKEFHNNKSLERKTKLPNEYYFYSLLIKKNSFNNFEYNEGKFVFNSLDYWTVALNKKNNEIVKKLSILFHKDKVKEILSIHYPEGNILKEDTPKKIANKLIKQYL